MVRTMSKGEFHPARNSARKQQHKVVSTVCGDILPMHLPELALKILVSSCWLSRGQIQTELGVSKYRVDVILDGYSHIRHQLYDRRDELLAGLYASISYVAGRRAAEALQSGKIKIKDMADVRALAQLGAVTARVALEHSGRPDNNTIRDPVSRASAIDALVTIKGIGKGDTTPSDTVDGMRTLIDTQPGAGTQPTTRNDNTQDTTHTPTNTTTGCVPPSKQGLTSTIISTSSS